MIEALLARAVGGDPGGARDIARTLRDPSLLPEFQALFAKKLGAVERKLAYEFLEYLAINARTPEVRAFVLARLVAEKGDSTQRALLDTLRLIPGVDCGPIEPFLASAKAPLRHAAIQALGACAGPRPVALLLALLQASEGGEHTRLCAEALARCGATEASEAVIDTLDGLERSRTNALAIVSLLMAAAVLCAPRHRPWLTEQLTWRSDPIERWLVVLGLTRVGTPDDGPEVARAVEAYLRAPTGAIHLLTGGVVLPYRTTFQAGMSFLHAHRPDLFAALSTRVDAAALPAEDLVFLEGLR
jgi:hypothetical protein